QHAAKMSKEAAMSLDPVVKTLSVPVTPQEAFTLFTVKMADWWPLDSHSLTANEDTAPGKVPDALHIDPRKGGLIEETKPDGTRHPWGTITAWEPGDRFAMTWHVGRPEAEATFLDVRFEAQGTGTRITLIHDGWAVLGDQGPAMRGGYFTGWDLVFGQCFAQACGAMTPAE
ncbi:MAG: SRPBCC family protein, partial [Pseudomonadota bacterium]